MNTRQKFARALLAAVLAVSSGGVWAQTGGVVGSQHDFTTGGGAQATTGQTGEVCVFCHTPHGSAVGSPVPLWNKVLPSGTAYTRYSSLNLVTFDASEAPVGSVTLACLSCHDGTQAMDSVINSPGSGGYNATGAEIDTGAIGVLVNAGTDPIPMLGLDLSDDHPVSMQYAGGGVDTTSHPADGVFAGTLNDPDFNDPFRATINTNPVWWVDSAPGTAGTREKGDMLLYSRNEASVAGGLQPFVECGSCHDPHNSSTQTTGSVAFLRIDNTNSQICTACHIK